VFILYLYDLPFPHFLIFTFFCMVFYDLRLVQALRPDGSCRCQTIKGAGDREQQAQEVDHNESKQAASQFSPRLSADAELLLERTLQKDSCRRNRVVHPQADSMALGIALNHLRTRVVAQLP